MKKFYLIIVLLSFSVCSFAYLEYWDQRLNVNGPYVKDIMSSTPDLSKQYATLSKQYVTDGQVDLSVSMQIGWYNFYKSISNQYWAHWIVDGYNYERKVFYAVGNSDSYTEIEELRVTKKYLDVSAVSKPARTVVVFSYSSQYNEMKFSETIHLNVEGFSAAQEYKLRVEYMFTPVPHSESDKILYNPDETYKYVNSQKIVIDKSATGSNLKFGVPKEIVGSIINVNGYYNPYYNTGAGERYLVYDAPDAIISVSADTANLPCTTSKVVGTSLVTKYGYGSFLASVGAYSEPTFVETVKSSTGCGVFYYGCSRVCNGVTSKSIEFLADNPSHLKFLNMKKYDTNSSCYKRYTNILTRSLNSDMSLYDENSVEDFNQNCRDDFRMNRNYHLRDFSNVVSVSKEEYKAGTILKLQHSAIYANMLNTIKNPKLKAFLALGYTYYGPTEDLEIAQGSGIVSNVIDFEVVSKVTLPRLTLQEKELHLMCVSDAPDNDDGIIHLKGKQINCGVYSPTLYSPEYMWEVSFDGMKWETITPSNFSSYIVKRHDLNYAIAMDSEKDLLLRPTILRDRQNVRFRQKIVLWSFASDELSSLYNYDGKDGKYYISISAFDYYTYTAVPVLENDNFAFSPLSFPTEQRLCRGEEPASGKINFRLRSSNKVSTEQINRMADMVDYKVYQLRNGIPSELVSNSASYDIKWNGETIGYRCVISWCSDSLFKDVWIFANPDEKMNLEKIGSSAAVCTRDKERKTISVLCPQSSLPTITVSDTTQTEYQYFYRGWVSFAAPDTVNTDFKSMTRAKITSFIKTKGWDYEKETGVSVSDADLSELRIWCMTMEHSENQKILADAKAENELQNRWKEFSYNCFTEMPHINPNAKSESFFVKKINLETGCESDSIKINVKYFDGIENNVISFASASDASKDMIYIVRDSDSPSIKGLEISGGYGAPASGNNNVYIYRYLYREPNGIWQPVGADVVVTGDETKKLSLSKGAFNVDRKTEICRVVISRNGTDVYTQVSDTSNILTMDVIEPLEMDDVVVSGDGMCAGTVVSIGIPDSKSSAEIGKRCKYVWKSNDKKLTLLKSGAMDEYCDIYNSTEDFKVTVYRVDTVLNARTPDLVIPIKVSTIKPYFSIVTNGNKEERILDYADETFVFQAGSRFELKNGSEGAESYVWNLELQYYTGQEIEGLKSYLENPVCYLYNQGQNKIRLTAKNSLGCEQSVTAENIYIQRPASLKTSRLSYFEQGSDVYVSETPMFTIYPTISAGEDVNVYYSGGEFKYLLTNSIEEKIFEAEVDSYVNVPFESQPQGLYHLCVWPLNGSDSAMQVYKILKK